MLRREMIDKTQQRLVDATCNEDAQEALGNLEMYLIGEVSRNKSAERTEYDHSRVMRQSINGALTELALRNSTEIMDMYFRQTGTLELDTYYDENKAYEGYSSTLRRFMATMHAWFGPALTQVMWEGEQGKMPQAALLKEGDTLHMRRLAADRRLCRSRVHQGRSPWPIGRRSIAGHHMEALETNIPHIAAAIIGRALHNGAAVTPSQKRDETLSQLDKITALSSVIVPVSEPILRKTKSLLDAYSAWEEDGSDDMFFEVIHSNPWYTSESYHRCISKGRLVNGGTCTVDLGITRPERFAVPPSEFLKTMGVENPGHITQAKIYIVSAINLARDSLFKNLPSNQKRE